MFKRLKDQHKGAVIAEDMEWSFYSELYDVVDSKADADEGQPASLQFSAPRLLASLDPKTAGMTTLDADADGAPDLLAWSSKGIRLYAKGQTMVEIPALAALSEVTSAAAGDFDNDGLPDLCVTTAKGAVLLRNTKGQFTTHPAPLPSARFEKARLARL